MKVVLRTNEDDWREIEWKGELKDLFNPHSEGAYAGHSIPEFIWVEVLRAAGVNVEVVLDDFGANDEPGTTEDDWESEGGQQ